MNSNNTFISQSYKAINLYDLILNLDKPVKSAQKEKRTNIEIPFEFEFLEEMTNKAFIELFIKGIKFIKANWTLNDLSIIKRLFFDLEDNNQMNPTKFFFSSLTEQDENKLDIIYKKDFILLLFFHRPLLNKRNNIVDLNSIYRNYVEDKNKEITLYLNIKNQNIIEFNDNIKFKLNKKDVSYHALKNFIFDKKYVIKTITSNCLISCYQYLIKFLYPNIKITSEEIKSKLYEYLLNHKIYFVDMLDGLYGLTLYNGTILINKKYCQYYGLNNAPYICIIFIILLHEIAHVSIRILTEEKNYFYSTFLIVDKYIDKNILNKLNINHYLKNNKIINESGLLFEELFFWCEFETKNITNYKYISHLDSIFIFNFNYERDYRIFRLSFKVNRDINHSENLDPSLKFSIEKKNGSLKIYLSPDRCINANLRFK